MYYTIYKTTNKITNKFYTGMHQTNNIEDNYMGSGIALRQAIKKYDLVNFTKEILYIFPTAKEMIAKEIQIVNENFISRKDTYNMKVGGIGNVGSYKPSEESNRKRSLTMTGMPKSESHKQNMRWTRTESYKQHMREAQAFRKGKTYEEMYGPKKATELRKKHSNNAYAAKPIIIDNITYPSVTAAANILNVTRQTIYNRRKI